MLGIKKAQLTSPFTHERGSALKLTTASVTREATTLSRTAQLPTDVLVKVMF